MIIWIVCQLLCWNDDRWIIKTDTEDLSRVLIPIFAIFTSFFSLSHPALLLVQIITLTQSAQLGRSVGVHVFSWLPVRIEEFLTAGAMVAHSFPNSSVLGHPWHHTREHLFSLEYILSPDLKDIIFFDIVDPNEQYSWHLKESYHKRNGRFDLAIVIMYLGSRSEEQSNPRFLG
jgi:hypothetical protein